MKIVKRMILPLALIGGAVAYASLLSRIGRDRRQYEKRQRTAELDVWEGEGGNPAPARPRSQSV